MKKWLLRLLGVVELDPWTSEEFPPKKAGYYLVKYQTHIPVCYQYEVDYFNTALGRFVIGKPTNAYKYWKPIPDTDRDESEFPGI